MYIVVVHKQKHTHTYTHTRTHMHERARVHINREGTQNIHRSYAKHNRKSTQECNKLFWRSTATRAQHNNNHKFCTYIALSLSRSLIHCDFLMSLSLCLSTCSTIDLNSMKSYDATRILLRCCAFIESHYIIYSSWLTGVSVFIQTHKLASHALTCSLVYGIFLVLLLLLLLNASASFVSFRFPICMGEYVTLFFC